MMNESEPESDPIFDDLYAALEVIEATRGLPFLERFRRLGLDPKTGLAGGDWRNCDFSKADLRGMDFRNSRLFRADFRYALVDGADFRGAGDVHTAKIHLALSWSEAKFDDYQFVLIQAEIEKMRAYQEDREIFRREIMTEKEWFFAIKACPSFAEANLVLGQMEAAGHKLSPYAYSYVLDRAKRGREAEACWAVFQRFLGEGGEPDGALYTAGIGVAPNGPEAVAVFNNMKAADITPDERAYNMVISKQSGDFTAALRLFHEMKREQIPISRHTIYSLFDSCNGFANAVTTLMEARGSGVNINDRSFVEELKDAARYPEMNSENIRRWEAEGLSYREIIGRLVNRILHDPFRSNALEGLGISNGRLSGPEAS